MKTGRRDRLLQKNELCAAIEAVLFAAGEPVEPGKLAQALQIEEDLTYKLLKTMQDKYDSPESGLMLVELSGSFQLCTSPLTVKRSNVR